MAEERKISDEILSKFKDTTPLITLNGVDVPISPDFEADLVIASLDGNLSAMIEELEGLSATSDPDEDLLKVWADEVKTVFKANHEKYPSVLTISTYTTLGGFLGRETSAIFDALEALTGGGFNISQYYDFRKKKASYLLGLERDTSSKKGNLEEVIKIMKLYT